MINKSKSNLTVLMAIMFLMLLFEFGFAQSPDAKMVAVTHYNAITDNGDIYEWEFSGGVPQTWYWGNVFELSGIPEGVVVDFRGSSPVTIITESGDEIMAESIGPNMFCLYKGNVFEYLGITEEKVAGMYEAGWNGQAKIYTELGSVYECSGHPDWRWWYQGNIFEGAGVVEESSNESMGSTKQLFR
jgi:hypothetical protein